MFANGAREAGGAEERRCRRRCHHACRTGGDVKLEVRNNWCNAGKRGEALLEGAAMRVCECV